MKVLTREAFSYAVLIIVLFGIATLAVREALDYITGLVPAADVAAVTAVFVSLTLGFMLVAGAFGVWTIHASGTAESRRRIAELVNSMDYIHDGVLAVDKKGRIRGANPAAQKLASEFENGTSLLRAFPGLSPEDQDLLLASDEPVEIERAQPCQNTLRELRFRSQPSAGVTLILASDISATNAERQRRRQVARLQLIGHLARGVANDFNSILCTISGHAALLSRLPPSAPQVPESVSAIAHHTQRGIALVTRLLEISQPPVCRKETSNPVSAVKRAVTSLCDNLPLGWQVEDRGIESLPPIGLTEEEIEQIVTHLGLLVADHMNSPGCIIVRASQSDSVPPGGARPPFAGVLAVHAREGNETTVRSERLVPLGKEDAGAVESVLRSMIEEAGGRLDRLLTPSGQPVFQVWLPSSSSGPRTPDNGNVSPELLACVANWLVFTALERNGPTADLVSRLRQMGVRVEEFKDLLSLVSRLEEGPEPDAILLDVRLSGNETTGLVRAVMRLKPTAGIVLLGDNNNSTQWAMGSDVRSISEDVGLTCVITTLIEAKTLAAHRLRQLPRSEDFLSRPQHALKGT